MKKGSKVEDHGGHFSKVLGLGGGHTGTFSGQSKTKTCDMAVIHTHYSVSFHGKVSMTTQLPQLLNAAPQPTNQK